MTPSETSAAKAALLVLLAFLLTGATLFSMGRVLGWLFFGLDAVTIVASLALLLGDDPE